MKITLEERHVAALLKQAKVQNRLELWIDRLFRAVRKVEKQRRSLRAIAIEIDSLVLMLGDHEEGYTEDRQGRGLNIEDRPAETGPTDEALPVF